MLGSLLILLTIFVPIFSGIYILAKPGYKERKNLIATVDLVLACSFVLMLLTICLAKNELVLLTITQDIRLRFQIDSLGRLFAVVVGIIWCMAGIFSAEYMKHEREEKRYFGYYLCVLGILMALCFSGNLITFYFFYECMTLLSLPLVFHTRTREAITAGIKYLLYSLFGAYFVLFGIYFLNRYAETLDFVPGGSISQMMLSSHGSWILVISLFMILGFGVKAGMFPLHGWLPTAHPVAPAPASAVLSGLIVKMGVIGIIRSIYYVVGVSVISGTWVQKVWLFLSLVTVFLGSMMAYKEKILKKRLAYSTVSQVSYILFGLALLDPTAMTGALLHVVFHACIKSCLFLSAGAIIYQTGKTNVDELLGIGKEMPGVIWSYTFASLALIGIPPACGFISKWYLAVGSLQTNTGIFAVAGPVILLLSALLTAGYLLPVTIKGFLPGENFYKEKIIKKEPEKRMLIPLAILSGFTILLGVLPGPLTGYITDITGLFF